MTITSSSVRRRPASVRSRCRTRSGNAGQALRSQRNCTALATLLTFWPPGPLERMKRSSIALSGMSDIVCDRAALAHVHDGDLALSDRNLDAVLLEQPPDRAVHIRAHVVHAFLRIGDPEPQLQVEAVVIETHHAGHRRRIAQDARLTL